MDEKKIKRKVNYYVEKYGTTDPYKLAKSLKVEYFFYPLGEIWGMYMYLKRHKCIFINSEIQDESMKKSVYGYIKKTFYGLWFILIFYLKGLYQWTHILLQMNI